jgi:tetratricopeptide (TPR) repeat protein
MREPTPALPVALDANRLTNSTNWSYLRTLARVYFVAGQVDKAVEVQKRALALLPESDEARADEVRWLAEYEKAKR